MIVGWDFINTLEAVNSREVLQEAIDKYGAPEIVNSDQGSSTHVMNGLKLLKRKWDTDKYGWI